MHILFVTGEYPPMRGGVGAYTACLAEALVAEGVTVTVLTSQQALTATDPSIRRFGQKRWSPLLWYTLPHLANQIGADWIHIQYQTAAFAMNPAINLAPRFWRWVGRTHPRVAWTYHDLLVPYLFPKAGARLRHWVTWQPARHSDLTIVTNAADQQQLQQQTGVVATKIPIGSNIAPYHATAATRHARRRARGYSADQLVLGYFGFLNRSKGGLTLIATLDELVRRGYDAHLLMIGERVGASDPTNDRYLHEVEAEIAERGLRARVRWTDHQPDAAVSADLAAIDLLLMPYLDGASLRRGTLMAGLAHGCPIVTTTPQEALPELVDGRDLCYVPPEDSTAAATLIAQLWAAPQQRQALGDAARQASAQFTWSTIARTHLTSYIDKVA